MVLISDLVSAVAQHIPLVVVIELLGFLLLPLHHLFVSDALLWHFFDLCTGYSEPCWVLAADEVVVVEVVLEEGTAAVDAEPHALKHRPSLQLTHTEIL